MSDWMRQIPYKVIERIKEEFSEEIKTEYEMTSANFSTKAQSAKDAKFPFVRMKTVRARETGQDLDNISSNAGDYEFWFYVSDNENEYRATNVAYEVKKIMKSMRFDVIDLTPTDNADFNEVLLKCARLVGSGDSL